LFYLVELNFIFGRSANGNWFRSNVRPQIWLVQPDGGIGGPNRFDFGEYLDVASRSMLFGTQEFEGILFLALDLQTSVALLTTLMSWTPTNSQRPSPVRCIAQSGIV